MTELRTLLSLELRSLYNFNKFLHTKDQKAKGRYRGLLAVWGMLVVMVFGYVGSLIYGLCSLGLSELVPAYLTVIATALILVFGLFQAGNRIFGQKGYDILASMPLRTRSITLSRFLALYIEDLIFTLLILLPGVAVYAYCQHPAWWFYPIALVGALFIPAIPLVISTLLGTFIYAISSRMKKKSMAQTLLSVLLVIGVLAGSTVMGNAAEGMTPEQFADLAKTANGIFAMIYPPATWLGSAMMQGSVLHLALFVGLSIAVIALTVWLVTLTFHGILRRLSNFTAKHNYKITAMQSRGLLKTLYVREAKRYFSSSIYVTNTILGPILGAVAAVALAIVGLDTVTAQLPATLDISGVLPFAIAAIFCLMTTTSTSISMEGKQFWIVRSLPIPTKTWLDSKMLFNLSLMLPCYVIAEVAMIIAVRPDPMQLLWLILLPASLMVFAVVFGITVNLKFHSFDWENEVIVVKQSLPAALGGFAGLFLSLFCGIAVLLIPAAYGHIAKAAICLLLWVGIGAMYRKNSRRNLAEL